MTAVLITGITGQDGSYLAEQLVAAGDIVHGLVGPGEAVPTYLPPEATLHEVDLLSPALDQVFTAVAPDEVYNLAGVSSVALSWSDPVTTARVNGELVARLLELAWQSPQPVRFLQASSAEIFAGSGIVPQDEQTQIAPRTPYGASKAFAHHLVQVYRGRGLHAVNAILYNHESPRRPTTFVTRKITSTVAAIADGRATELVLGNLDARRDWGWAPDYVRGQVLALRHEEAGDWVLATGRSHAVEDFVAAAFAALGITDWRAYVRTDSSFTRPTDAPELVGDPSKARAALGWACELDLADIVQRMVLAEVPT